MKLSDCDIRTIEDAVSPEFGQYQRALSRFNRDVHGAPNADTGELYRPVLNARRTLVRRVIELSKQI